MAMKVEEVLHMVGGAGKTSYACNSTIQERAIAKNKNMVEEAIREVYRALLPQSMMVADLGCSSGPNTFLVVSQVIDAIGDECRHVGGREPPEIQFFLNDLPGNDFNSIFRSLEGYEEKLKKEKGGHEVVPHFVVGAPGSFYGQLFPRQSVHFFHSSSCLHWLSQVPRELEIEAATPPNGGDIYISQNSPPVVVKSYQDQFKKDFSDFLKLRFKELHFGGRMVLTFVGRKQACALNGEANKLWELLAHALKAMVSEGLLEKEKVDAFNLPYYTPCMEEVKAVIQSDGSFDLYQSKVFEFNWDPFDDSINGVVFDNLQSGENIAQTIRAVIESMITSHFEEKILDELFSRYAKNLAEHLLREKTKYVILAISLKRRD